jgi:hypothetical protein
VPKLADPRTLHTFAPNVTYDWEAEKAYGSVAVAIGRALGKAGDDNRVSVDETWTDLTVGGRVRTNLSERTYLETIAFLGGGGSDPFVDAYVGIGHTISDRLDGFLGYRFMKVERENGDFLYYVEQKGPMFGVAFRF